MKDTALLKKNYRCFLAVLVVLAAVILCLPSVDNIPVHDDVFLVVQDVRVNAPMDLRRIWQSDYWPGNRPSFNYRPVTTMSYAAVIRIDGPGVILQRAANIALHAGCSLAVFFLAGRLSLGLPASLIAGIIFRPASDPFRSVVRFFNGRPWK